jgi:hypothetical protein
MICWHYALDIQLTKGGVLQASTQASTVLQGSDNIQSLACLTSFQRRC